MNVSVDPASPVPPFEQLRQQLLGLIVSGRLAPGTRLPSIRQLAADLDLAAGTVARAYAALESDGLVVTGGARGTRVAAGAAAQSDLQQAADEYIASARARGLDLPAAIALVQARFG